MSDSLLVVIDDVVAGTLTRLPGGRLRFDYRDDYRLAPLYDVASALPYSTHEQKLRFAMKIGGDYRVFLKKNPWRKAAAELGVDPDTTVERIRALATRVPDAFADAARSPEIAALDRPLPNRLVDLIADRAARCLDLLR